MSIKALILTGTVALACAGLTSQAQAKGCLKGAAVGGGAGHFVGSGHAVAGAVGGCVVGHHMANKKDKEAAAQQNQPAPAPQPAK